MTLANFNELKEAIGQWRFDEGLALAPLYDEFILLCEDRVNNGDVDGPFPTPPLRVREMETAATLTLTDGAAALPTGFLGVARVIASYSSPRTFTYATPDWYSEAYPQSGTDEGVDFYTIVGSSLYSKSSATLALIYYLAVPALSDANTTNWLLVKSPRVYLYGTLLEASIYRGDTERAMEAAAIFRGALTSLQMNNQFSTAGNFAKRASGQAP